MSQLHYAAPTPSMNELLLPSLQMLSLDSTSLAKMTQQPGFGGLLTGMFVSACLSSSLSWDAATACTDSPRVWLLQLWFLDVQDPAAAPARFVAQDERMMSRPLFTTSSGSFPFHFCNMHPQPLLATTQLHLVAGHHAHQDLTYPFLPQCYFATWLFTHQISSRFRMFRGAYPSPESPHHALQHSPSTSSHLSQNYCTVDATPRGPCN